MQLGHNQLLRGDVVISAPEEGPSVWSVTTDVQVTAIVVAGYAVMIIKFKDLFGDAMCKGVAAESF